MKVSILPLVVLILLVAVLLQPDGQLIEASSNIVSLKVASEKKEYYLGEVVSVETRLTNNTSKPLYIHGDSRNGTVIKIAFNQDSTYRMYSPPSLGFTLDGVNVPDTVAPHKTLARNKNILWNDKPDVSHLNADAARPIVEGRILTDYAMPEAGTYFVKFCAIIEVNGKMTTFESKPIEIIVKSPEGADRPIWKEIKENGNLGRFLQTSEFPRRTYRWVDEQNEFEGKIRELIHANPNGIYAESLRRNLLENQAKVSSALGKYNPFYFNKDMSISIVADKTEYLQSEPIGLICRFTNETSNPQISILPDFSIESRFISETEKYGRSFEMADPESPVFRRPLTFQPRTYSEQTILLDTNLDEVFPNSGTYRIRLRLPTYQGVIESNPVQITIREPIGVDKEALDFMLRHNTYRHAPKLFAWRGYF